MTRTSPPAARLIIGLAGYTSTVFTPMWNLLSGLVLKPKQSSGRDQRSAPSTAGRLSMFLTLSVLTAGVASCDSLATLPDDQMVGIEVHQAFANLESNPPMLTFTVRVANHGNQPLYSMGCHPRLALQSLEKWIGDEWQWVYAEGCSFGRWTLLRLGPGEIYETTFRVPRSEAVYPSLEVEALPGRYRAEFQIGRSVERDSGGSRVLSGILPVEFTRVEFEVPDP